jgi:hypothetical protein
VLEEPRRASDLRCAYCHAEAGLAPVECQWCGTLLHSDCAAALGTCPTLGCGTLSLSTEKRQRGPVRIRIRRWRRMVAMALVVALAAISIFASPVHFAQHLLPLFPIESAPGERRLPRFGRERILETARALMKDPKARGYYWSSAHDDWQKMESVPGKVSRPKAAVATDSAALRIVDLDRREPVRSTRELPEALAALDPVAVAVHEDVVVLTWRDDVCYPYGYGLVLLEDASTLEVELRRSDHRFRRNVELMPGVWSWYLYH